MDSSDLYPQVLSRGPSTSTHSPGVPVETPGNILIFTVEETKNHRNELTKIMQNEIRLILADFTQPFLKL